MAELGRALAVPFWNAGERRPRSFWRLAGLGALYAAASGVLFPLLPRATPLVLLVVLRALVVVASVAVVARLLDQRPLADFGLGLGRAAGLDLAFGLAAGAALMSGVFLVEWSAGWVVVTGSFRSADPALPFAGAMATLAVVFAGIGLEEELLFRGYLLRNLAEGLNHPRLGSRAAVGLATLVSSAAFGLVHAQNPSATLMSTCNVAVAGVFLSLGLVLTGRLALSIGLHITWNLFQGGVWGLPVSGWTALPAKMLVLRQDGPALWTGGAFGPEAGILVLAAMVAGGVLVLAWVGRGSRSLALRAALAEPPVAASAATPAADEARSTQARIDSRRGAP